MLLNKLKIELANIPAIVLVFIEIIKFNILMVYFYSHVNGNVIHTREETETI